MISSISQKIVHSLYRNGEVNETDQELLVYGLTQGIRMCMNILTALVVGLVMGMWWQGLLFMAAFIPVRSFAGGYHAKTPLRCYWYSVGIILVVLYVIRFVGGYQACFDIMTAALAAMVFFLAPVESKNKPLSGAERTAFRSKARRMLFMVIICAAALRVAGKYQASNCLGAAVTVTGLLVLAGKLGGQGSEHRGM